MEHIQVIITDLPCSVRGFTIHDGFENYTIFINAKLNIEMQKKTYDHEIAHIDNHDFDSMISVNELEQQRHAV